MVRELKPDEIERFYEIGYYIVMTHLRQTIANEKLQLFIENFCRVFNIDYTSISIANANFLYKLKPTNYERSNFAAYFGLQLSTLNLDYRTIRSHRKLFQKGEGHIYPRTIDKYMRQDMREFVRQFIRLYPSDALYLLEFFEKGGFNDPEGNSEPTQSR